MIDVRESRELQAAIFAMKMANRELRREIYKRARAKLGGEWAPGLASRATTPFENRVLVKGARTKVSTEGFTMVAATSRRLLSGGLLPSTQYAGAEWGAKVRREEIQTHTPKGRPYKVTKFINRQFRPRQLNGVIVMETASDLGTRLVRLWVETIVETYAAATQGDIV
jgi:hypothetical protein